MQIKVIISDNLNRHEAIIDNNTTLRSVLEENGYDTGRMYNLSGEVVQSLDTTFASYDPTKEDWLLVSVTKTVNA